MMKNQKLEDVGETRMIKFERPAAAVDIKLVKMEEKVKSPLVMKFRNVDVRLEDLDRMVVDPTLNGAFEIPDVAVEADVGTTKDKHIVIPSFGTITSIFRSHLMTLKQLRLKIDLLK